MDPRFTPASEVPASVLTPAIESAQQNFRVYLYTPLEPWFDKTWRPGEIEIVR
jgi:hypothetical protein